MESNKAMIMIQSYAKNKWVNATDVEIEAFDKAKEYFLKNGVNEIGVGNLDNRFFTYDIRKKGDKYYLYNNSTNVGREIIELPLHEGAFRNDYNTISIKNAKHISTIRKEIFSGVLAGEGALEEYSK